jgi:hypothetical protein
VTVEVVVETKAVVAAIEFDVTLAEAMNPVLQLAMREGFAEAVGGMLVQYVSIVEVAGQAVAGSSGRNRRRRERQRQRQRQRRLQQSTATSKTEVKFKAVSPEPGGIDKLHSDVKAAAAAGDIVATIIQKAASRSVLTPAMAQMETRVANLQTSVQAVTAKVVETVAQGTPSPIPGPTPAPTPLSVEGEGLGSEGGRGDLGSGGSSNTGEGGASSSSGLSNVAVIAIGSIASVAIVAIIAVFCVPSVPGCRQKAPGRPPVASPVVFGSAEDALTDSRRNVAQA